MLAFLAALVFTFVVTVQYGDIADRRYRAIIWEPIIAGSAAVGIMEVVKGWTNVVCYILGATVSCALAIWYMRKHKKTDITRA